MSFTAGEVAGIRTAELEVQGRFAFGYLSGEKGTHRLVRQSPFNTKATRETSFVAVDVMPLLGEVSSYSRIADVQGSHMIHALLTCRKVKL